ncbi:MAG: hypothetical protein HY741_07575 [Chloroflexi bacterium]|nr:hypothetical protein [Chloroflexota bacterium]
MNAHKFRLVLVLLGSLFVWLVPLARAQSGLTIAPTQLTLAGTHCYGETLTALVQPFRPATAAAALPDWICSPPETRTVLLQATQTFTQVKFVPLDLTRADGVAIIPAAQVRPQWLTDTISANQPVTVPVTLDLRSAPGGQFTGNLLLSYYNGSQSIPLNVSVKDPWLAPFAVLLLGILLGVGVSAYRTSGKPRDQVRVRASQLRAAVQADQQLAPGFAQALTGALALVDIGLQSDNVTEAQTALTRADTIWKKWSGARANWLAQLAYQQEIMKRFAAGGDFANLKGYTLALQRAVQDVADHAPDFENPSKLRERLDALIAQLNKYLELQAIYNYMWNLHKKLTDDQVRQAWQAKLEQWQTRLATQTLDKPDQVLEGEINQGRQTLDKLYEDQAKAAGEKAAPPPEQPVVFLQGAPAPTREAEAGAANDAARRLQIFTIAGYAIAVALLAGIGFNELYITKATFGAQPWTDYFSLLVWGFGAEATRQSLTSLLQNWNLPGVPAQGGANG